MSKSCVVCRTGQRQPGETSHTMQRDQTTITVHHVPGEVCDNCGEAYLDGPTVDRLQQLLADAIRGGVRLAVVDYIPKVA